MQDSLLREVNDDVRAERLHKLWLRHRSHLVMLVVAILLATVGDSLWTHYKEKRGGEWLQQMEDAQALMASNPADAATRFATIAGQADGDLRSVAQLWEARADVAAGKRDEALALLKQTVQASSGLWSDLACLRLASLDPKQATCLAAKQDSPLAAERRQWAAANAWAAGDTEQAAAILNALVKDPQTPQATHDRAQQWLALMPAKKADK